MRREGMTPEILREFFPIEEGQVRIRCPKCLRVGWCDDDDSRPLPSCCGVLAEVVDEEQACHGYPWVTNIEPL